ncbi:MAG: pyrroline-5-carboxylate reductase [Polaromonas sp. 39-63-203]|jgi:pyrroline-5-carboxylate reductase|uniref:pyrroline-5-carboxylate reductase n=1 Tax=Polaromonas sp. TaxID=1869339 RepID=UPI000BC7EDDA|nr:pyrroline-5-carboxylate reductase [Polaromonas sp.]OZB00990.1 MAG: pyrroline-5-carboxylate reductase [Polaromonas sp. 39-63-203]HQS33581.1 pyrroline-5-carboxylate reductase [Polaromonas sp.]HQS92827.1 pyrroline-5-carboxylate reductase [Polaromonas sp.]
MTNLSTAHSERIAFIGGGNMASAIIGGLIRRGLLVGQIQVVEPWAEQRARLQAQWDIQAHEAPGASLSAATLVVWAVKPQVFREAALPVRVHARQALHLSVAAGIRSESIAQWLESQRVVRAMPNTPALIGKGITALFARVGVTAAERLVIEGVVQTTGDFLWLADETQLDAVTALSGSGPAYVFYFIEAMIQAGTDMGLSRAQAHQLAVATFVGASALAQDSSEPPEVLRARVTSKGGTTYAALSSLDEDQVRQHFIRAMQAARQRASEMGDEFGSSQA